MPKIITDYFEGRLMHFIEHEGRVYVDTDDIANFLEQPTLH